MITILDRNRNSIAVLENAFDIGYEKTFNEVWGMSFSLPYNDSKRKHCKAFNYVELKDNDEYIGLYRISPSKTTVNESSNIVTYECDHVLSTLLDKFLFRYHQLVNLPTKEVLTYLLNRQEEKHWKLGTVAFNRYFSYKWENENILSALASVPKPFDEQYIWTWDTQSYPWTLNLVEADDNVKGEIRYAYNMKDIKVIDEPDELYNRIYALGYGEGVNQLGIEKVNKGLPYVEDEDSIKEHGLKEYVWTDKRFEDPNVLKGNATSLLKQWKNIKISAIASAADVSKITGLSRDKLTLGKVIRLIHPDLGTFNLRIMKESKSDIIGEPGNIELELGNVIDDIATLESDLQRKQEINDIYSQGAVNIDSQPFNDNCDSEHPAVIRFRFPDEMVRINTCKLSYETNAFRAYERATKGGGAVVKSTSAGGGTTATSSSGGGTTATSSSGGGTTATSSAGGAHRHLMFNYDGSTGSKEPISNFGKYYAAGDSGGQSSALVTMPGAVGDLYTKESSGNHSHSVTVPNHTHSVEIPNHTHSVTIPNHSHEITLPDHTHELEYGIYEYDKMPTKHIIKVDGKVIPVSALSGDDINIVPYLSKDSEGKINRGWHELEIQPNNLARVTADVVSQFFIQSRGGGDY